MLNEELAKLINFEISEDASEIVEDAYTKYVEEAPINEVMSKEEYELYLCKLCIMAKELELKESKVEDLRKKANAINVDAISSNNDILSLRDLLKI